MTRIDPSEVERATQGKYEVLSLIAEGGMGAVFMARHRELGSLVAIKILPPDVPHSPDRLARFRREAAVTAQLSHPYLVPVFEFNVEGDFAYLIMPYIDGTPLDVHLKENGPMTYDDVRTLISHIGSALTYAHNRGIIHRDIKPANILLEKATGRWLVTDFGVAHVETDTTLTRSGATVGTPAYMAPEQLGSAAEVDARADLYALAAVAFEALTGNRGVPMAGVDELAEALAHQRPDLTPHFVHAVTTPLATARDERPASVQDWLDGLDGESSSIPWRGGAAAVAAVFVALAAWRMLPFGAASDTTPVLVVFPFDITISGTATELDSALAQAITMEIQRLPDIRVLQPAEVSTRVLRLFGRGPHPLENLLTTARDLGAEEALLGVAEVTGGRLEISLDVYDVGNGNRVGGAMKVGRTDSLHVLVSDLVIDAVARRMASARSGTLNPSLPTTGMPAVLAWLNADRAFKRGAFPEAIEHLNRVIALDSTFAMAYFKRMLATILQIQPSKTGPAIRSALVAASQYRSGLDPVTGELLKVYETLLLTGNVNGAERGLDSLTREHPNVVDAWFLLGILRFRFATALDVSIQDAKFAFQQALFRDPTFAPALGQLLQISILENDRETTQRYMSTYLDIDRASVWADLIGVVDTLLFRRLQARTVLATFPTRPKRILENIALSAGELRQPPGTNAFAVAAIEALADRAETPVELAVTFRMRMATFLGSGQRDEAREYLQAAGRRGVPQSEIDRWIVLTTIVGAPELAGTEATLAAVGRLLQSEDEPFVSAWLAARWARVNGEDGLGDERLRQISPSAERRTPIEQSLLDDLDALDQLADGDTVAALATWDVATTRYSVEDVVFGLANSLWALRLDRARVLAASGRARDALDAARTFDRMAGFVDQVAWLPALTLQVETALSLGDTNVAVNAYDDMFRVVGFAGAAGAARRDSIARLIGQLRN